LRGGLWDVPDDDEPVGPSEEDELTDAKAAYKAELLGELEERKAIKNVHLQEKREIQEEIRGLRVQPFAGTLVSLMLIEAICEQSGYSGPLYRGFTIEPLGDRLSVVIQPATR
ncbi:hypothetical protein CDV55_100371, partial [Aspergillus turcosus]